MVPGCGDFGVRRALEMAMQRWTVKTEQPIEQNVVVAGIGCSGNLVHLLEGQQPYGFHGIHGRSLPLALGVKMGNPERTSSSSPATATSSASAGSTSRRRRPAT